MKVLYVSNLKKIQSAPLYIQRAPLHAPHPCKLGRQRRIYGWIIAFISLSFAYSAGVSAQDQSPLPGSGVSLPDNTASQAAPENDNSVSAPVPGNVETGATMPASQSVSITGHNDTPALPVSLKELQTLVENVKNGTADKSEESLNKYLYWLDALVKAHHKLACTFSKQSDMSASANNEHNLSKQLSQLKDQLLYLKAQILIKQKRWNEAVNILVDIVSAEPQSALGQQAYRTLKECGFSPDPSEAVSKSNTKSQARQISRNLQKVSRAQITPLEGVY